MRGRTSAAAGITTAFTGGEWDDFTGGLDSWEHWRGTTIAGVKSFSQTVLAGTDFAGFDSEDAGHVNRVASFGAGGIAAGFDYATTGTTTVNLVDFRMFGLESTHGAFSGGLLELNIGGSGSMARFGGGGHAMDVAGAMQGLGTFAFNNAVRRYERTGEIDVSEDYTDTTDAGVLLRSNYSFGNQAAVDQARSIADGTDLLRVGGDTDGALGETTVENGQRVVHLATLGEKDNIASQLAAGSVLQWEAHRDGQDSVFQGAELFRAGTAQAQMVDRMVESYGIEVALANPAVAANYLTWTNTAAVGNDEAFAAYLQTYFDNESDAMRPFVDDDEVGIKRAPWLAGGRRQANSGLDGQISNVDDFLARTFFGDSESLLNIHTGDPAAPRHLPGETGSAALDAGMLGMTALSLGQAKTAKQVGLTLLGVNPQARAGSAGELAMSMYSGAEAAYTASGFFGRARNLLANAKEFVRPTVTDWDGVSTADQAHRILSSIDRELAPIFNGEIVTPRQMGFAANMPERQMDRQVFRMMDEIGLPTRTAIDSNWTAEEARAAANQIARNYIAIGMLTQDFGVDDPKLMQYLAYGGPGPSRDWGDGITTTTWYDGFTADNVGPIDFTLHDTRSDVQRLRQEVSEYNYELSRRLLNNEPLWSLDRDLLSSSDATYSDTYQEALVWEVDHPWTW